MCNVSKVEHILIFILKYFLFLIKFKIMPLKYALLTMKENKGTAPFMWESQEILCEMVKGGGVSGGPVKKTSCITVNHSRCTCWLPHLLFLWRERKAALFAYFCIPAYSDIKTHHSYTKWVKAHPSPAPLTYTCSSPQFEYLCCNIFYFVYSTLLNWTPYEYHTIV